MNNFKYVMKGGTLTYPPIPEGCIGYWDFTLQKNTDNNRTKAFNLMEHTKSGELKNFLYSEESGYNNGLALDGIDDYIEYPALLQDRHNVTFFVEVENYQGGALFAEALEGGYGFGFQQSENNYSLIRYNTSGFPRWLFDISKEVLYNKSFTLALTVADTVAKLYIDNELYSENLSIDTDRVNATQQTRLHIGQGGKGAKTYWGRYKLLRFGVWSRALEESEVEYISSM